MAKIREQRRSGLVCRKFRYPVATSREKCLTKSVVATGVGGKSRRTLAMVCPKCGYRIRVSRAWLLVGTPRCYCGGRFLPASDLIDVKGGRK